MLLLLDSGFCFFSLLHIDWSFFYDQKKLQVFLTEITFSLPTNFFSHVKKKWRRHKKEKSFLFFVCWCRFSTNSPSCFAYIKLLPVGLFHKMKSKNRKPGLFFPLLICICVRFMFEGGISTALSNFLLHLPLFEIEKHPSDEVAGFRVEPSSLFRVTNRKVLHALDGCRYFYIQCRAEPHGRNKLRDHATKRCLKSQFICFINVSGKI